MSSKNTHPSPPSDAAGFQIFVRASYTTKYNFAVANYNAVSNSPKAFMRDGFIFLYRSVVAVAWIIATAFALIAIFGNAFFALTAVLCTAYILLSCYNLYVYFTNRSLLNTTRLLRAKMAGPSGLDHEWVSVPLDSRSANERLAACEPSALDNIRREYGGKSIGEIECLVYTSRYADIYPAFPKELCLHFICFLGTLILGFIVLAFL